MHRLPSKPMTWAITNQGGASILVVSELKARGKVLKLIAARNTKGLSDLLQKSNAPIDQHPRASRSLSTMVYIAKKSMDRPSACNLCRSLAVSCPVVSHVAVVPLQSR